MSKKFYAVNRKTGERWKPKKLNGTSKKPFLVLLDSGYAGVIHSDGFYTYFDTLDPSIWRVVVKPNAVTKEQ